MAKKKRPEEITSGRRCFCSRVSFSASNQLLFIDNQLKLKPQGVRRLPAENHPVEKNFKIVHHRAIPGVNVEFEFNERLVLIDLQLRLGHRIVDPVMDIKLADVLVAHPAAADVGFVRQNQRRRHGTDRRTCPLVVVANGSDHLGNVQGVHMQMVQQAEAITAPL